MIWSLSTETRSSQQGERGCRTGADTSYHAILVWVSHDVDQGWNGAMSLLWCIRVESNAQRYLQVFSDTIGTLLSEGIVAPTVDLEGLEDVYDVLVQQRQQRMEAMALNGEGLKIRSVARDITTLMPSPFAPLLATTGEEPNIPDIPAALTRRFEVRLLPRSQGKAVSLREVKPRLALLPESWVVGAGRFDM